MSKKYQKINKVGNFGELRRDKEENKDYSRVYSSACLQQCVELSFCIKKHLIAADGGATYRRSHVS
jgi:hypothetical protein